MGHQPRIAVVGTIHGDDFQLGFGDKGAWES